MKKIIGLFILATVLLISTETQAQSKMKLGHVDFATLYSMMPGLDSVKKVFEDYNKAIQEQYAAMQTELENKFMDYQQKLGTMTPLIQQMKEDEINDLRDRMSEFEQTATQDLQNKELELTSPIIEEARKAVEEVAKENGYTYIFNSTEGLLLYATPSDDVMDMVKAKLKITKPTPQKGANPDILPN
ncbi:MAG TPA: OmpH family outer membrane protein [Bacteroidales bacterium]|nr:OmpH family outer membrane protein [Bacteroidales bacterium]HPE57552.1 OmpH family outer membrane protein [Bacteroidales bacterium]HRX97904.1 OmpH family outer membrane protein [Bacteroidales bacterium]